MQENSFIKNNAANVLTCFNLFCGCMAIYYAQIGVFHAVFYWIVIAAIFDFLDGFVARATKTTSNIGKDLDSLADMVTFGLAPGLIIVNLIDYNLRDIASEQSNAFDIAPFIGFFITIFSAVRLANFNNDTRQVDGFIGMPTPVNGLFIASLAMQYNQNNFIGIALHNNLVLLGITLLCSMWLIIEMPLIALKFKSFSWKENQFKFILILFSIVAFALLKLLAIPVIMLLYIALSVIANTFYKKK